MQLKAAFGLRLGFLKREPGRGDIDYIGSWLRPSDIVFEWGPHPSTAYLSSLVREYHSVDHDPRNYDRVVAAAERAKRSNLSIELIRPQVCDRAKLDLRLGYARRAAFERYIAACGDRGPHAFDRVVVNGPARIECALSILPYLACDSLVFLNGFLRHAPAALVRLLDKFYDLEAGSRDIVVVRKRAA